LKFSFNPFRKKGDRELKEALRELTLYRYNLANLNFRIKSKMQILESRLSAINPNKDESRILANEYSMLDKLSRFVDRIDLFLLQISLRLESLIEFKSLISSLQETTKSLNKLQPYLAGISEVYSLLIDQLNDAMAEMGVVSIAPAGISISTTNEEAENLLNSIINYSLEETDTDSAIKDIIFQAARDGRLIEEVA